MASTIAKEVEDVLDQKLDLKMPLTRLIKDEILDHMLEQGFDLLNIRRIGMENYCDFCDATVTINLLSEVDNGDTVETFVRDGNLYLWNSRHEVYSLKGISPQVDLALDLFKKAQELNDGRNRGYW